MSDLFGSPVGTRLLESDYADVVQSGLGDLYKLGQIAQQPYDLERLKAQTRLENTKADAAEEELANERRLAELSRRAFSGATPGTSEAGPTRPVSMADQLDSLARMAAESGMIDKASKTAAAAAQIRQREAAAQGAVSRQMLDQQRMIKNSTGLLAQYFGAATDAESWQRANELFAFQTGQQSPYASVPFSGELVDQINQSALTSKERFDLIEKELARDSLESFRSRRLQQHDTATTISRMRLQLAREREQRLAKAGTGGKGVTTPSGSEISLAKTLFDKEFPAGSFNVEGVSRAEAAMTIASDARALRRQNPALDPAAAMRMAFENAKRSGDFQVTKGKWAMKSSLNFERRGLDTQTPMPLPKSAGEAIPGRWYSGPRGTALWTGDKFVTGANATRWLSENNPRGGGAVDSEDDDEGDEE